MIGDIQAESQNGTISFINHTLDQEVELKTRDGRITIELGEEPSNVTYVILVSDGRIDLFGESTNYKVVGEGERMIKLTSNNGSITVK